MQACKLCNQEKMYSEFPRNSTYSSGHTKTCKSCTATQKKAYYQENKERICLENLDYYKEHRDTRVKQMRLYTANNQEKERIRRKRYREKNLLDVRARESQKTKLRRRATPPWANLAAIKEFYKNCPKGYHVDHIVPLRGDTVCGLHVLENLQYLPAKENLSKGNKWQA